MEEVQISFTFLLITLLGKFVGNFQLFGSKSKIAFTDNLTEVFSNIFFALICSSSNFEAKYCQNG